MFQKHINPFIHYEIKDFLTDQQLTTIKNVYDRLEFFEKHTDLFKFLQTDELKAEKDLGFFKDSLLNLAKKIELPEVQDIDLFASYYRKGDYLLCHDDLVDDRQYAFSYYLENYDSGELVFYNEYADTAVKRISVQKNTLVLFHVSSISFHEVDLCLTEGRKAFTGWLHYKEHRTIIPYSKFEYSQLLINKHSDLISPEFNIELEINVVNDVRVTLKVDEDRMVGPFYSRRVMLCHVSPLLFIFKGLNLYSKNAYKYTDGCYLLLNDSVNEIEGDVYDFWYFLHNESVIVKYVNESGEVEFELEGLEFYGYLIRRGPRKIFIERTTGTSILKHYVYIRAN